MFNQYVIARPNEFAPHQHYHNPGNTYSIQLEPTVNSVLLAINDEGYIVIPEDNGPHAATYVNGEWTQDHMYDGVQPIDVSDWSVITSYRYEGEFVQRQDPNTVSPEFAPKEAIVSSKREVGMGIHVTEVILHTTLRKWLYMWAHSFLLDCKPEHRLAIHSVLDSIKKDIIDAKEARNITRFLILRMNHCIDMLKEINSSEKKVGVNIAMEYIIADQKFTGDLVYLQNKDKPWESVRYSESTFAAMKFTQHEIFNSLYQLDTDFE